MHTVQFLVDRMLQIILLLSQPLNPPDFRKELADLFLDILAILLGPYGDGDLQRVLDSIEKASARYR